MDLNSADDGKKQLLVAPGINDSINLDDDNTMGKSTQDNTLANSSRDYTLNQSNDNSFASETQINKQQEPGSFDSTTSNLQAYTGSRNDSGVSFDSGAHSKNSLLKRQKALEL